MNCARWCPLGYRPCGRLKEAPQHLFGLKPQVRVQQVIETLDGQSGCHQQHQRQRQLSSNQESANSHSRKPAARAIAGIVQNLSGLTRSAVSAGKTPKTIPASSDTPSVKSSTVPSMETSSMRGKLDAAKRPRENVAT